LGDITRVGEVQISLGPPKFFQPAGERCFGVRETPRLRKGIKLAD